MKQVFYHYPEMKNDLIVIYNEIEEAYNNVENGDLWLVMECIERAKYWLEKYVSKDDVLEYNLKS
jgi:hypothetical protein